MQKISQETKFLASRRNLIAERLVDRGKLVRHVFGDRSECPGVVFVGSACTGRSFSLNSMDESSAFMLLSSLAATQSRSGRRCIPTPDRIEKLSRFDLNCATLILVFRVAVVSVVNLYQVVCFKIRNSNGNAYYQRTI